MDVFVCGEFAWITCGTWLGFWSGAIGALVAAFVGGMVALFVVRLTNAQQRHGVERTVEIAALADCVAVMEGFESAVRRHKDPEQTFDSAGFLAPMTSAVARLQMSRQEAKPVADILIHWPGKLRGMALHYDRATLRQEPFARDVFIALQEAITTATVVLPWSTSSKKKKRSEALKLLREADTNLDAADVKFDLLLPTRSKKDPTTTSGSTGESSSDNSSSGAE
ncbi:hypothetical protein [Arthrobacter sp. cf158]|uniref:hypothetical protein n=1 Tax=Arthrobacter sp. cf158 TaxID=1761744 RepID=UPI000B84D6C0|nr:hypothetical protein [Arthrobacter sp. cf158]